jgi:ferredoxin
MSLPVEQMVRINSLEHKECILCGNCIDECAHKAIHYTFSSGGKSLDATLRTATNRLRH